MRSRWSLGMPLPSSTTFIITSSPVFSARTMTVWSGSLYLTALSTRLTMACSRSVALICATIVSSASHSKFMFFSCALFRQALLTASRTSAIRRSWRAISPLSASRSILERLNKSSTIAVSRSVCLMIMSEIVPHVQDLLERPLVKSPGSL